jgi:hypothetical protein
MIGTPWNPSSIPLVSFSVNQSPHQCLKNLHTPWEKVSIEENSHEEKLYPTRASLTFNL